MGSTPKAEPVDIPLKINKCILIGKREGERRERKVKMQNFETLNQGKQKSLSSLVYPSKKKKDFNLSF